MERLLEMLLTAQADAQRKGADDDLDLGWSASDWELDNLASSTSSVGVFQRNCLVPFF